MKAFVPRYLTRSFVEIRALIFLSVTILHLFLFSSTAYAQPRFSHRHGFYETPFALTIIPSSSGSDLYFTNDGSVPGPSHGTLYTSPLLIDTTTVIRAVEVNNGTAGKVSTSTYLFADDIVRQPNDPEAYPSEWGPYTALSGTAPADYEMDPEIMAMPGYADSVKAGLLSLPVISIVTDRDNLFSKSQDPLTGGIYIYTGPPLTNTTNGLGYGWERPASMEYFDAEGSESLQIDCALEIQGNHGRRAEKNPKHSFRLTFKTGFGPQKLVYPFFGADADSVQNTIILRGGFGNTWVHWSTSERSMAQYLRDRWTKDAHLEMGHFASHGFFAHLFLNGLYWGVYNPSERLDCRFAEMYLGGKYEDYDVIKDYAEVSDGTITAWNTMMAMANAGLSTNEAYQKIQGKNPDGTVNNDGEALVDVTNLADYMLLHFYGGNWDWDHHNWVAMRNRNYPGKGFKFFAWDGEHMIEDYNINILSENNNNRPSRVFRKLLENDDFKRLFADRVQRHCFDGGVLTSEKALGIWKDRAGEIDKAIHAESARWGDYRRDVHAWNTGPFELYTKETHWLPQKDYIVNTYFPNRTASFIQSLRNEGLFPAVDAPLVKLNGNPAQSGYVQQYSVVSLSAASGDIYYTTDGSDPVIWDPVPAVSPKALRYTSPLYLEGSVHIRARCQSGGVWSAATERYYVVPEELKNLKITEIHYHPAEAAGSDERDLEFIEIKNTGSSVLNLKDVKFVSGVEFSFFEDTPLKPGEFTVLASDGKKFREHYGLWPDGIYKGQLDNGGENIIVVSMTGDTICNILYGDGGSWPEEADGQGYSLVPVDYDPDNDQNLSEYWRASHKTGGSPGKDDKIWSDGRSSDLLTVYPNYPNPFTNSTTIKYHLTGNARITVTIINSTGQQLVVLEDEVKPAGLHEIAWDGLKGVGSPTGAGIYFYKISAGNQVSTGEVIYKMMKIR
ncbi:MAG: CotH kinase family protein [Bacteroidales bacterium]|nr:CotH kinase family protein [Bacteroidales bacterium]